MANMTVSRLLVYPLIIITIGLVFSNQALCAFQQYNGFDVSDSLIDVAEIHHGGPAKDGIPAIDAPIFITANKASYLLPDDRILGLSWHGLAKAYPVKILNYHEIVNDFFADQAVVITYCPLCGSGVAYSSQINGINTTFGVSGLLYNSDVLLYDRETQSLWSQLLSRAISGSQKGSKLTMLPLTHTTWRDWQQRFPDTKVLSNKTGYKRDYRRSPYGNYDKSKSLYFPVKQLNSDYHPKEYVLGLDYAGEIKAYPFAELSKVMSPYEDDIGGRKITVHFDDSNRTAKVVDEKGQEIPTILSFWFAWMAFYPESQVFKAALE